MALITSEQSFSRFLGDCMLVCQLWHRLQASNLFQGSWEIVCWSAYKFKSEASDWNPSLHLVSMHSLLNEKYSYYSQAVT